MARKTNSSKRSGGWWWLFLLAALAAGLWYFFLHDSAPKAVPSQPVKSVTVQSKQGDFRDDVKNMYGNWYAALEKAQAHYDTGDVVDKQSKLDDGSEVQWVATNIVVKSQDKIDVADVILQARPAEGKLAISKAVDDTWQGDQVQRYDIIWNVEKGKTPLSMTIAHFYVYPAKKAGHKETAKSEPATEPAKAVAAPAKKIVKGSGKLAIVVDDCGADLESQRIYEGLGRRFTFAVMPYLAYTKEAAQQGHAAGMEIILHLPMEPMSGQGMEPKTILVSMNDNQIRQMAAAAIANVPYISGVNNHQGSRATSDSRVMKALLSELQHDGLFYLDSRTAASSVGASTAAAMGVPTASNELFLDNSSDEAAIKEQIRHAIRIAQKDGYCIAIGHCRPHTARAVRDMISEIDEAGVELVFVSSLLH